MAVNPVDPAIGGAGLVGAPRSTRPSPLLPQGSAVGDAVDGAIAVLTVAAFSGLRENGFVRIDDPHYLVQNPHLAKGLSADTIAWAFRPGYASNWHPLTWISHAVDVSLWGLDPWPHHATSLALHVASVPGACPRV